MFDYRFRTHIRMRAAAALAAALGFAACAHGQGQTLKIGLASEPTAVDPHYHQATPNGALGSQIFDTLVGQDSKGNLAPLLATSWKTLDDKTWVFNLRQGVKFSNGAPFTAQDAIFTFCRMANNPQSISGAFKSIVNKLQDVQATDPHTLRITTRAAYPLLPHDLTRAAIISSGIVQHGPITFDLEHKCGVTGPWPRLEDFNDGKDAIGTGPYKLKSYVKGVGIELVRNDGYWGKKPEWKDVKFVPVPNAGPRLTGLLAGDFDVIESPAARDLPRIKKTPGFGYVATPSDRVIFLQFDVGRSPSPMVQAPNGKNPLQDVRVRRAISMAIDRETIAARIMSGMATPAYQFVHDGMFGALPKPPVLKYDPQAAKKLLAEAGYPDGFDLTIASPNDRYINDGQIAQAVAQYLARVGIRTKVDAMTRAVYFPKRAKREFSFSLGGWSSDDASSFLQYWITSYAPDLGLGTSNYGRYSNPELDQALRQALTTIDPDKRAALLRKSLSLALADLPCIPLHFESSIWAFRKGLTYEGRADQYTLATSVHSVH